MVLNIALDKAEFATCINGKLWFEGNYIFCLICYKYIFNQSNLFDRVMFYKMSQQKEYFIHIHKKYNVNHFTLITVTILQFSNLFISCEIVNYIGIEFE